MKKRQYIISGIGYSLTFDSIKERNQFTKLVDYAYNSILNDKADKFTNKNVLYYAVTKSVYERLKDKMNINFNQKPKHHENRNN